MHLEPKASGTDHSQQHLSARVSQISGLCLHNSSSSSSSSSRREGQQHCVGARIWQRVPAIDSVPPACPRCTCVTTCTACMRPSVNAHCGPKTKCVVLTPSLPLTTLHDDHMHMGLVSGRRPSNPPLVMTDQLPVGSRMTANTSSNEQYPLSRSSLCSLSGDNKACRRFFLVKIWPACIKLHNYSYQLFCTQLQSHGGHSIHQQTAIALVTHPMSGSMP
jgi:hypothetical protein